MYCSKCGYQLEDGTNFCRKCGSKNIYNNLVPNEKKSTFNLDTSSKETNTKEIKAKEVNSKQVNTKQANSKKINSKQTKPKGFIILGILILLLSVGFGSYYLSISKLLSDNSKKSEETTPKNKVAPTDTTPKKDANIKPDVPASTAKTDISNINSPDYYIFPKSGSEKLIDADVSKLIKENLTLARNEIYARHGLVFKGETFKSYFSKKTWYTPNPNFKGSDGELNDAEKYNIQLILKYEK
ncbi:YARHG domain-containing protein [Clostridium estertheticum]|uniref:YARHG domain-containing protein n=1 Tax=Clostridium estertheticum TaxID=238834 RepID=UPI0013E95E8D|nr:YARHG domain-containing protein [Clostridium estertheticum]MBZ9685949.1 YARHG domain-containing protein [Clostridium estertheticum]